MLTGLQSCYSLSIVSFSATYGTIFFFDRPNKISWHEDDLRMSYCCKGSVNYRVIGLITWCGRPKSRQRGGKLMALS